MFDTDLDDLAARPDASNIRVGVNRKRPLTWAFGVGPAGLEPATNGL
jgi:hypothetical protein